MNKKMMNTNARSMAMMAAMTTAAVYSPLSAAADIDVELTNLTQGIYFTPLLLAGHNASTHLFETGMTASPALQAMAEGGAIAGLMSDVQALGAAIVENPAGGLLAPASKVTVSDFNTQDNEYLSITAMILPSNDGFVGLDGWKIPTAAGVYTIYLNAYDAGTEANDELITGGGAPGVAGIPANPGANGGSSGSGVTDQELTDKVHIHRGNVGDSDATGGNSDLDSRIHRWLNPVAKLVVTVKGGE